MKHSVLVSLFLGILFADTPFIGLLCKDNDHHYYTYWGDPVVRVMYDYYATYDKYPENLKELIRFHTDYCRYNKDGSFSNIASHDQKLLTRIIKDKHNTLSISGDTCHLYVRKFDYKYSLIESTASIQSTDHALFRHLSFGRSFNKEGVYIWRLTFSCPSLDKLVRNGFGYCAVIPGDFAREDEIVVEYSDPIFYPIMLPFTMKRSGEFTYDSSFLKDWPIYFREYPFYGSHQPVGRVLIEDAIDDDYLNEVKSHLHAYLISHPEVETVKSWELMLFNKRPDLCQFNNL